MKQEELFERAPVSRAILTLVVPSIISQLITVFYNMADTFFIGQLNDPAQVAAATVSMPVFVVLTGIANLFGIGGASLIARCLGAKDRERARSAASFSVLAAGLVSIVYGLLMWALAPVVLPLIGADGETLGFCLDYLFWTVTVGAVPTVLSAALSHMVRAEGHSSAASFGIAFGGLLNIALDPLFLFVFEMDIKGAAIATMLSNLAACGYYVCYLLRRDSVIGVRHYRPQDRIARDVIPVGMPGCIIMLMGIVSNVVLNRLVSSYSTEAIAGMGIAKKVDMLVFAIANGMSQGVLPLIAYTYFARAIRRMRSAIKTTFLYSILLALFGTAVLTVFSVVLLRFFIGDAETVAYGQHFLRVICLSCPCVAVTMMIITLFQATGKKGVPMLLSFLRKGVIDVPFMIWLSASAGAEAIPWATPISDVLAMLAAVVFFVIFWRSFAINE